jgi:hypothetical protein
METKLFDNIFPQVQKLDLSQAVLVPGYYTSRMPSNSTRIIWTMI